MDPENSLKNEVRAALLRLHQKIDSIKEKVDKLCESTENCQEPAPKSYSKERK